MLGGGSNGSILCMIGGAGNLPSKMARTKSRPDIDAITSVGVTPYSILGAGVVSMGQFLFKMMIIILKLWPTIQ